MDHSGPAKPPPPSKTIEEYGLKVYKQSETATIASMIDAISNDKFNLNTGVLTC